MMSSDSQCAVGSTSGAMHVMRRAWSVCCTFVVQDDAATMAEYALLIALIAMVIAVTLLNIATAVKTKFSSVSSCLAANSTC